MIQGTDIGGIYIVCIFIKAKFGKIVGLKLPFELGNVGEFWLFTAFIGAFCMQIIRDERALPPTSNTPAPHSNSAPHSEGTAQ